MNRWLAVAFLVAFLEGASSLYWPISLANDGLSNIADSLNTLSVVMNNYYLALNSGRTTVNATLNDFGYYVNVTYAAMNKTYGATQPNLPALMTFVQYFNQSIHSGEFMVNQQIATDLNLMTSILDQAIGINTRAFYESLGSLHSYSDLITVADNCVGRNRTQMVNVPTVIAKLAPCLQQEVNTATAIIPTVVATIKILKSDLKAYSDLLNICQPTSKSCIDKFFAGVNTDFTTVQSALDVVVKYINAQQLDAANRNRKCGELVNSENQGTIYSLRDQWHDCVFPRN